MTISKRKKAILEKLENKPYKLSEAVSLLQDVSKVKFVESVDVNIGLGIDTRKGDQVVRGAIVLPHGTGRKVRVAVFAQGANADDAKAAGADLVGNEDLLEEIKAGNINFDILIATPDMMRVVGQLGQILGPKGLMPNPKEGTVTKDVTTAVKNAKGGQVMYRADKAGIVNCTIGKVNFSANAIKENLDALLIALKRAKPSTSKGIYFKKIYLSTTMGPGLLIDPADLPIM